MGATLDAVASKKSKPEPTAEQWAAEEVVLVRPGSRACP